MYAMSKKQGDRIQLFAEKKPQEKVNGLITCHPLRSVDGLCYRIIY